MKKKVIFVVLLLMVIAISFLPTSFAVFKSLKIGTGSIDGAEWDVSLNQTGINSSLRVIPGLLDGSYVVNVRSHSEVDVTYSIVISSLPANIEVSLDGGAFQSQVNHTVTFSNVGTINYNDVSKERSHTLAFKATAGAAYLSNQEVNVDVKFKQALS